MAGPPAGRGKTRAPGVTAAGRGRDSGRQRRRFPLCSCLARHGDQATAGRDTASGKHSLVPGGARSAAFHKACPGSSSTRTLLRVPAPLGEWASSGPSGPARAAVIQPRPPASCRDSSRCWPTVLSQASRGRGPLPSGVMAAGEPKPTARELSGRLRRPSSVVSPPTRRVRASWELRQQTVPGTAQALQRRTCSRPGSHATTPSSPGLPPSGGDPAAMGQAGWPRHTAGELFSVGKRVRARSLREDSSVRPPRT